MMDDGMLSQEEIDALLNATSTDDDEPAEEVGEVADSINQEDYLTTIEVDTLGEIGNISFGSSATTLSTLLNQKVDITTPQVAVVRKTDLLTEFEFEMVSVEVKYIEGFTGQNVFVIKAEDAAIISDIMLGGDGTNPDYNMTEIHLSAVQEAMNQMMGAAATSMSTIFKKKIDISPPIVEVGENAKHTSANSIDEEVFVQVSFQLKVGDLIDSNIMQIIPFPFANELVDELLNPKDSNYGEDQAVDEIEKAIAEEGPAPVNNQAQLAPTSPETAQQPATPMQPQRPVQQQADPQFLGAVSSNDAPVQQAAFAEFQQVPQIQPHEQRNLGMLLDIPLKVTVELGRTERSIKDILDLSAGSIIELDKLAGEPVDVFVNEKLIAKGEVVVIEENFGVRVTDILSTTDRIMKLK
ncbi:flagellar motor switch phosphatase FliY [Aciduricibacillus chroicocephali]|uniref:Flagellar motor switch phosphatase FliY n=1 Tax=Aciduricibacillus chroicocephali TaxID=3054939 RepID=A0ABY9KYG0_9BACI|nr:flagellar motor switch phosphatase FliY [Bacillaceae bacterium 44XB]